MPELPEVQTIVNNLRPVLHGKCILGVELLWEGCLATPTPEEFRQRISGMKFDEIERRGKFLVFRLSASQSGSDSDETLLIHLRMSGDLLVEPTEAARPPHHRLILLLDDGQRLAFNDTRKFGRVWLTHQPENILGDLGPEPLDENFTPQDLYQRLAARHRQLKPLLLDQNFLAGMGNIYTDEALHLAHLHPLTLSDSLSFEQAERLWESIRQVLQEGIRRNGASIDWVYRGGDFQNYFRVYQRTGEPCMECGAPIQRMVLGQRSTHFCPVCQPAKR